MKVLVCLSLIFVLLVSGCVGQSDKLTIDMNKSSNLDESQSKKDLPGLSDRNIQIPKFIPETGFQLQFAGEFDKSVDADLYDLDLYGTDISTINELHSRGKRVVCYINVGAWEDWRDDKEEFPNEVIGNNYVGWPGEKWLDIRRIDILGSIMGKRFDLCKEKGFDGIEPDNINGFENPTGFDLTYEDQLKYNIWLSEQAHERGLSIGLKNDGEQAKELVKYFDFAVVESCFTDNFCEQFSSFIQQEKAVFMIEYTDTNVDFKEACEKSKELEFTTILKNRNLDSFTQRC